VPLPAEYNLRNAFAAAVTASALGVSRSKIVAGLAALKNVPGRWQEIDAGQGRRVVIDYAVTPVALRQFYTALRQAGARQIIAVFGATGGGRDKWKRPELGKIAGDLADHIFLTSEDPFDEDPNVIANAIMAGVPPAAQNKAKIVTDRREAIKEALAICQPGDVIALTGMGSETTMNVSGGKKIEWNDAQVVREVISR
jgi:UDP-N-acetylmuramoyl-L-alanyl-D-glutamate--2,6-diaminopimelate ligase